MSEKRKSYPKINEFEEEIERIWTTKVKADLENNY